jgi:SAM-dependent methyltransferase
VAWCADCGLSQLEQVVDPKLLYTDYPFRAGTSDSWRRHCAMLMTSLESAGRRFLVDIGSNDGTLLHEAVDRGWKVLGVDPCPVDALPSLEVFWTSGVARRIGQFHGQADVITATNVFGHVDDAKDFLEGIALLLKPRGVAIIECPHIFPLLEAVAFDTIYHEHLSYWSLIPLERLAEQVGLRVTDVRMYTQLHGGTMRYVLQTEGKVQTTVAGLRVLEHHHFQQGLGPYQTFAQQARERIEKFGATLRLQTIARKRIWGYGANAKGAVLLQATGLTAATMERIVDDTEAKQGLLMPGTDIPITDAHDLSVPDILVLLSWNNAEELKAKAKARGFRGRFLLPHD